ncbi:MAG: hypothetical protein LBH44_04315 [Treponema sp.]|jgi:hypothetical protein|nr:hypothetical protein [Treponema sp.]
MKKYVLIAAGVIVLIMSTVFVINASAKSMAEGCLPDASCCEDANKCGC